MGTVERRRKIQAGEPGVVQVLDIHKRRHKTKRGRRTGRDSFHADFGILTPLAFDLDCRKIVEFVSLRLAEHFERSLLAGVRADGAGPLPGVRESTRAIAHSQGKPHSGHWGERSGWMARHWLLGKIRGHLFQSSRKIKPNGSDGRSIQINRWLTPGKDRPAVDLQSVDGAAAQVIADAVNVFVRSSYGSELATQRQARTRAGTLPQLRR